MALSSFLLASKKKTASVDTELDALFKSSIDSPTPTVPADSAKSGKLKRKHQDAASSSLEISAKKHKAKEVKAAPITEKETSSPTSPGKVKSKKKPEAVPEVVEEDVEMGSESEEEDENDSELENTYLARTLKSKGKGKAVGEDKNSEAEEIGDPSDAEENDDSPPQHESLTKKQRTKKLPKSKYVPPAESTEQRDLRTIFIGNLSVEVSQEKSLLKSLQRHILSLIPISSDSTKPKIESTRFRSVPFAVPTSKLEDDDKSSSKKGKSKARQHDINRTGTWKKSSNEKDADKEDASKSEKQFLTPAQKKKIAFINQEIHASGSSVNAYIVFAHSSPSSDAPTRRANLPPLPEAMDPYKAARLAKEACDGSEFMGRMLRVDIVGRQKATLDVDPKRCVFVGNLDFESKVEDVRVFFEGVISAEKGPRVNDDDSSKEEQDDDDDKKKPATNTQGWVTHVRIIRDKDTQLGKGFAYVQFAERDCVDEILALTLEPGKLKFAKRKLRVERCKTIPQASVGVNAESFKQRPSTTTSIVIPKGDPTLGDKLAHLSKDERKSAKAANADRMARRLAKKKARMSMAVGKAGEGSVKIQGKNRERERKTRKGDGALAGKRKGHGIGSAAKNKGKAMSARSLERRNAKK
ncbi:hypothetical protein BT96DRAFT_953167 [Gymnopus androsaceus JB14]|uniref:Nucleolar protein 12 n=1 Tax=Gymnopus androsaceus JB14 TaxID=1447944 RepID=A0A6A4IMA0_9AGAR|nr:hypothetical protein BT96DRAFT_953167 [Gymnopus androsaceus JB14]